jgi:hypothetical protein
MVLNKGSYISAVFGGVSVVLVILCVLSFEAMHWDIADYLNEILPFPEFGVKYPVKGVHYLVPGCWLTDTNGMIFILCLTGFLSAVSIFLSFYSKRIYGYNALLGFGFSMSFVSILYGMLVFSWLAFPF